MKVYTCKILAKIYINENILPIFLIYVINILVKTIIYKETKNNYILKTVCPISIKQLTILISVLSLACWVYSNGPKVSFYFPETSFRSSLTSLRFSMMNFTFKYSKTSDLLGYIVYLSRKNVAFLLFCVFRFVPNFRDFSISRKICHSSIEAHCIATDLFYLHNVWLIHVWKSSIFTTCSYNVNMYTF